MDFHCEPKACLLDKGGSSDDSVTLFWQLPGFQNHLNFTANNAPVCGLSESQNPKHDNSALQQQAKQVQEIEECAHKVCKRLLPARFIMLDKSKDDWLFTIFVVQILSWFGLLEVSQGPAWPVPCKADPWLICSGAG